MQTAQTVVVHTITMPNSEALDARVARGARVRGVSHPALVTLFDLIAIDATSVLAAVEFVPAQPLRRVVGGQPLHPRRAAEIASEVADAIAELHAHGFRHGAISIDSVLLTTKGKAKLDLVEALRSGEATEEGDLRALNAFFGELSGHPATRPSEPDSAAVMAAQFRDIARREPSR